MPIFPSDPDADFKMITTPGEWPVWPFLPMKKFTHPSTGQVREYGVFLEVAGSVGWIPNKLLSETITKEDIQSAIIPTRSDIRLLLEDGWRVD